MSIGDGVVANGLAPRRLLFRQVDVFWRTHHRVTTPDILLRFVARVARCSADVAPASDLAMILRAISSEDSGAVGSVYSLC